MQLFLSVSNAVHLLWLSGSVYGAKSCSGVFLAGKFLILSIQTSETFLLQDASSTKRTEIKRIDGNSNVTYLRQTIGSCYVLLFSGLVNY